MVVIIVVSIPCYWIIYIIISISPKLLLISPAKIECKLSFVSNVFVNLVYYHCVVVGNWYSFMEIKCPIKFLNRLFCVRGMQYRTCLKDTLSFLMEDRNFYLKYTLNVLNINLYSTTDLSTFSVQEINIKTL